MKSRGKGILTIGVIILFLIGCKKVDRDYKETTPIEEENSDVITWVYQFYPGISEENQNEINRLLHEKGINYQIRFILPEDEEGSPLVGEEYAEWICEYEKTGSLDIITSNIWAAGDNRDIDFIKDKMTPLDSYLETPEGLRLKESYTADEWKQCSVEGSVYVVPKAATVASGEAYLDNAVYIAVNNAYISYFDGFDGTYESLRVILDTIGNDDLHIVLSELPGERILYGLMGCSDIKSALPFRNSERSVIDITKTDELKVLLKEIYSDFESGVLLNYLWSPDVPKEKVLAFIYTGKRYPLDGFTDYLSAPDTYEANPRGKYGICKSSKNKDQAFQILSLCFSDIDILCLLYPGADKELMGRRKELLNANPNSELAGIRINFYENQTELLNQYTNSIMNLVNNMQRVKNPNSKDFYEYEFNPMCDIDSAWKQFIEETGYFSDWCSSANQQIQKVK